MAEQTKAPRRWRPSFVATCDWRDLALGVGITFGQCVPREWSIEIALGPFYVSAGFDETWEWTEWQWQREDELDDAPLTANAQEPQLNREAPVNG